MRGIIKTTGWLAILRQIVQPSRNETVADLFGATERMALLRGRAAGDANAEEILSVDWTLEAKMQVALGRIEHEAEPAGTFLAALSGGQLTQACLGLPLFSSSQTFSCLTSQPSICDLVQFNKT